MGTAWRTATTISRTTRTAAERRCAWSGTQHGEPEDQHHAAELEHGPWQHIALLGSNLCGERRQHQHGQPQRGARTIADTSRRGQAEQAREGHRHPAAIDGQTGFVGMPVVPARSARRQHETGEEQPRHHARHRGQGARRQAHERHHAGRSRERERDVGQHVHRARHAPQYALVGKLVVVAGLRQCRPGDGNGQQGKAGRHQHGFGLRKNRSHLRSLIERRECADSRRFRGKVAIHSTHTNLPVSNFDTAPS